MDRVAASINPTPKFFNDLLSVNANLKGAYITNTYGANTLLCGSSHEPHTAHQGP